MLKSIRLAEPYAGRPDADRRTIIASILAFARHRTPAFAVLVGGIVLLTLYTFVRLVAISPTLPYYVTP